MAWKLEPELEVWTDEENQEITIGIDLDGDGDTDITWKSKLTEPWLWGAISVITLGIYIYFKIIG